MCLCLSLSLSKKELRGKLSVTKLGQNPPLYCFCSWDHIADGDDNDLLILDDVPGTFKVWHHILMLKVGKHQSASIVIQVVCQQNQPSENHTVETGGKSE